MHAFFDKVQENVYDHAHTCSVAAFTAAIILCGWFVSFLNPFSTNIPGLFFFLKKKKLKFFFKYHFKGYNYRLRFFNLSFTIVDFQRQFFIWSRD